MNSTDQNIPAPPIPFLEPQLDPQQKRTLFGNIFLPIAAFISGADAATAANYGSIFIADRAYEVLAISEVHRTAGTDAGAVTLNLEKCTSGTAPDSGVTLLATAFDLKASTNTPRYGTLTATKSNLLLARGDRLILKDSGVLTGVADVAVTVILRPRA